MAKDAGSGRVGGVGADASVVSGVAMLLLMAACSGSSSTGFDFGDGGTSNGGGSGGGGGGDKPDGGAPTKLGGGSGGGVGGADNEDCPASAKLVYVTGEGSKLYSFYPPAFQFTLIGTLGCLGAEFSPTHMTVDRTGTAWVVAWDASETSSIFTASTANAECTKLTTWTPKPNGTFSDFALTFIGTTNAVDTTLYLLGSTNGEFGGGASAAVLGSFDTASGLLTTIGQPDVANPGGDMTTNGDGTLYYLQDTSVLDLYEINPTTAAVEKSFTPGATGGGDQALAFYGGSFYAFEDDVVYQFDPSTSVTTKLGKAPLQVTGAGQSTCVPTTPPASQ